MDEFRSSLTLCRVDPRRAALPRAPKYNKPEAAKKQAKKKEEA